MEIFVQQLSRKFWDTSCKKHCVKRKSYNLIYTNLESGTEHSKIVVLLGLRWVDKNFLTT